MGAISIYGRTQMGTSQVYGAVTATANGTGVDCMGYSSAMAVIVAGAWTDGTHTFELQESDDNSTYTAVADADLEGTEPVIDGAADDDQNYYLGYKGSKRYLRVKVTVAGTTTGAIYGAYIIKGNSKDIPVNS